MKLKLDRIISVATLIASVTAILLVLRKPAPVATSPSPASAVVVQQPPAMKDGSVQPQATEHSAAASAVFDEAAPRATPAARLTAPAVSASSSHSDSNPRSDFSSIADEKTDAISSALTEMFGGAAGTAALSPNSKMGNGTPVIKDQQVTMEGDVVHGRFLTEIGGRDVWVTISGRMGEKDGYATFDPTEFKVGDTSVPVSLVNPALQRKMAEERERLKITGSDAQ
ncbi:MAG TPA: hypothetical protein VMT53_14510 [Terriglobales bacterium]|nr:hypothetical protein [Terriglobales bacterium]